MPSDHDRALNVFGLVCNVVERAFLDAALREAGGGLTRTQYLGLRFIGLHKCACIRDLAASLHVSHPAAVKLVERLVASGLVERDQCPDDRRRVCLKLTAKGEEAWRAARARQQRMVEAALDAMGRAHADRLQELMLEFVRVSTDTAEHVRRVCLFCGVEHDPACPVSASEEEITGKPRADY